MSFAAQKVKLTVVGDSGVGKTSLFKSYATKTFALTDYISTVFDSYTETLIVDDATVYLALFDTAGHSDYDRLRPLSYPQTDVFLICFSLVDPGSYENVRLKWYPELSHHGPTDAEVVLVGTKLDLCNDPETNEKSCDRRMRPIQYRQGIAMRKDINAARYCECSAFSQEEVKVVFQEAVRAALKPHGQRAKKKRGCVII